MFPRKTLMEELADYIKKNLRKGYTKDSLKWALINQGYSRLEVERALKIVDMNLANEAPILKTKPEIKYEVIEEKSENKKDKKWSWFFWRN